MLFRKLYLWGFLVALTLALSTVGVEAILRAFWHNPFAIQPIGAHYNDYLRLHPPFQKLKYDATGLYAGAHQVTWRTGARGELLGPPAAGGKQLVYLLGGSTTECEFIDEGKRWPGLLDVGHVINFGVSGNSTVDSYFNLKFLLAGTYPRPDRIVVMEAINDIGFWDAMEPERWRQLHGERASNSAESIAYWNNLPWVDRYLYAGAFVHLHHKSIVNKLLPRAEPGSFSTSVLEGVRRKVVREGSVPLISKKMLDKFYKDSLPRFLTDRARVLELLVHLANSNGIKVTFLTQPNSLRSDYHPQHDIDLRLPTQIYGHRLSLDDTARILRAVNSNTVRTAQDLGAEVFDMADAFEKLDPTPLFYDEVHLTAEGAKVFAFILNTYFRELNLIANNHNPHAKL
jgi:lysophospholipase L1-like esterase